MKVRFTAPFEYRPTLQPRVLLVFNPRGGENGDGRYTVKRECGEQAIAEGKAVREDQAAEPADNAEQPQTDQSEPT